MISLKLQLCEQCGKSFYPKRPKQPLQRFCSTSCTYRARVITHHCLECHTAFDALPRAQIKFCSDACRKRYIRKEKQKQRMPELCTMCGMDLALGRMPRHRAYCSRNCYEASEVNKICRRCSRPFRIIRLGQGRTKDKSFCSESCRLNIHCETCYEPVYGHNRINGDPIRFCSRDCASFNTSLVRAQVKYRVRGYLATLERIGKIACEECGMDDPLILNVHHRDHNHANNQQENLQTLCANCHVRKHRHASVRGSLDLDAALRIFQVITKRKKYQGQLSLF